MPIDLFYGFSQILKAVLKTDHNFSTASNQLKIIVFKNMMLCTVIRSYHLQNFIFNYNVRLFILCILTLLHLHRSETYKINTGDLCKKKSSWYMVLQLVEAVRYKPEGRWFYSRWHL
jgi:hypothetical protein